MSLPNTLPNDMGGNTPVSPQVNLTLFISYVHEDVAIATALSNLIQNVFGSDVAAFQIDQFARGQVMHTELDQLARILQVDIHESHLKQPALVDIVEPEFFHFADERRIGREAESAAAHAGYDSAFTNQAAGIALELEMNVRVEGVHIVAREAFQILDAVVGAFHPGGGNGGTLQRKLHFASTRHPTVQVPGSRGGNGGVGGLRD